MTNREKIFALMEDALKNQFQYFEVLTNKELLEVSLLDDCGIHLAIHKIINMVWYEWKCKYGEPENLEEWLNKECA